MGKIGEIITGFLTLVVVCGILGWIGWRSLKRSEDPARLAFKWVVSAVVVFGTLFFLRRVGGLGGQGGMTADYGVAFLIAGATATCGLVLGIIWGSNIGEMVSKPFTGLFDGGEQEVVPEPLYSIAEAKRKQGKYIEAATEVRKQLAQFPNDFKGRMMLAEIQAENLNDVPGAQLTIERLLNVPELPPMNGAFALNRLADWHLKFSRDPDSAREALQRIIELFPDTEQTYLAAQRIAHLTPPAMLAEKNEPHRLKIGLYQENIGLLQDSPEVKPPGEDPATAASSLVRQLEDHPLDSDAREKLAVIYAEYYQRTDLAADQIEELISQPNAPQKRVVHWLNLLADLHIKTSGNLDSARQALQRIMDLFPQAAAAETAKNRMAHLKLELRSKKKSQVVKLGSYEQNLGLKKRPTATE
jgi:tetratricopeptide (TPR) repeat protein